jgi:hypothetical protein
MNFENYENVDMERLVNDENYEIERTSTFGRVLRVVRKKPEEEGEIDTSNIGPSRLIEAFERVGKPGENVVKAELSLSDERPAGHQ